VAALLALGPKLDTLYHEASANCFTSTDLGISPDAARLRREAKKMKKSGSRAKTPATAQNRPKKGKAPAKKREHRYFARFALPATSERFSLLAAQIPCRATKPSPIVPASA